MYIGLLVAAILLMALAEEHTRLMAWFNRLRAPLPPRWRIGLEVHVPAGEEALGACLVRELASVRCEASLAADCPEADYHAMLIVTTGPGERIQQLGNQWVADTLTPIYPNPMPTIEYRVYYQLRRVGLDTDIAAGSFSTFRWALGTAESVAAEIADCFRDALDAKTANEVRTAVLAAS